MGANEGAMMAAVFAAAYPERVPEARARERHGLPDDRP